jgi:HAD superfamily hydrolase (TIGR01509 family)
MMQLQGLIFDVDGTLANTERDGHRVAFNSAFEEAKLDWHWSVDFYGELLQVMGGKERINYFIHQYQPNFINSKDLNEFTAYLHQLKTKYYLRLLRNGTIKMRPGVIRLIKEARKAKLRLAIATTSSLPNVIALLEKYLDLDWFEVIAAGDIVAAKKPAPDIYQYVINKMQIPPQNLLVFEDSEPGLIAAKSASLKTIITVNNYTKKQNFSRADLVISDLGEPDQTCQVMQGDLAGDYLNLASLQTIITN